MSQPDDKRESWADSRLFPVVILIFIGYLLFLFLRGSQSAPAEQYELLADETVASATIMPGSPAGTGSGIGPGGKAGVIQGATFDEQGFPVVEKRDRPVPIDGELFGKSAIYAYARDRLKTLPPEQILQNFQSGLGYYWKDPAGAGFADASRKMGQKLTAQADRNRRRVTDIVKFLKGPVGTQVSTTLKENLQRAILSPAREPFLLAFSAWKNGDLDQAYRLMKQAEALDPDSRFMQIMAHHAMAFLNMEKHGPLEETMRHYRDLAQEAHGYISSFKPALEKAGFDPVRLYGRDPFDARGLPTKEQFEKAMNQSLYVQFEREYYKTNAKSPGRRLNAMRSETIEYMRHRQKGGAK